MADEIIIETTSAEVIEVGVPGPQGPAGAAGTGLETLTTQGDTLYRGASTGQRLPIGTTGQILRVSDSGIPEWGAAPASGVISVNDQTGEVFLDSTDILTEQALQISDAGTADCNGFFVYGGLFNGRPTYYATKDTFVYYDGSNWAINHNGDDQYFGTATTYAWQAVWSLGDGANPLPVVAQAASHDFEQVVGQRTNPTARGDAASKNVGTGANDVAAGNHTHSAATQSVAGFLSAADKTKLDGIAAGAEVNVNADWTASSGDAQILNKPTSLTPTSHAASHAAAGSDPVFDQDLNTGDSVMFVNVDASGLLTAANGGIQIGVIDGTERIVSSAGNGRSIDLEQGFIDGLGINAPTDRTNILDATDATKKAAFDCSAIDTATTRTFSFPNASGTFSLSGDAPASHTHGNLTNDGKLGSTSGLPVVTTTSGAVTTLALGTAGQVLQVNSGATGVEFAAASGGGFGEVRFDTATVYTYTGQAAAGASESASVWFIRRSEYSSAGAYVSTTTANNVQWANRLTATYT